jgi:hypothetical protein
MKIFFRSFDDRQRAEAVQARAAWARQQELLGN